MAKKKPLVNHSPQTGDPSIDFLMLIKLGKQALELVQQPLDDSTKTQLDSMLGSLRSPAGLSLIQLTMVPKLIQGVQTAWAALKQNDSPTEREALHKQLTLMISTFENYSKA